MKAIKASEVEVINRVEDSPAPSRQTGPLNYRIRPISSLHRYLGRYCVIRDPNSSQSHSMVTYSSSLRSQVSSGV